MTTEEQERVERESSRRLVSVAVERYQTARPGSEKWLDLSRQIEDLAQDIVAARSGMRFVE